MNEFIEKLIGRLEELYARNDKTKKMAYEEQDWETFDLFTHRCEGIYSAISIVKQLAEEYKNDFCEWKFETTGIVWHCNGCETYNLPYAMNLRIIADDFECKCPHCGKKIKVVE